MSNSVKTSAINVSDLMMSFGKKKQKVKKEVRQATEEELGRAAEAITMALEKKCVMSYGKFWSFVTQNLTKSYKPTDTGLSIRIAEQVKEGASALLVNKGGKYGASAPVKTHHTFLAEHEFPEAIRPEQKA